MSDPGGTAGANEAGAADPRDQLAAGSPVPSAASEPAARPRPQYGEYASPEEQRAAIKKPEDYYDWLMSNRPAEPTTGVTDASQQAAAPARALPPVPPAPPSYGEASGGARPGTVPARPRGADRFATFALLGLGLFETLQALLGASTYADTALEGLRLAGVTGATAAMVPSWLGYAVAAMNVVIWLVALWLSVMSLRRGRLTFWIPLAAGALAGLAGGVLLFALLLANPDFVHILSGIAPPASGSDT